MILSRQDVKFIALITKNQSPAFPFFLFPGLLPVFKADNQRAHLETILLDGI